MVIRDKAAEQWYAEMQKAYPKQMGVSTAPNTIGTAGQIGLDDVTPGTPADLNARHGWHGQVLQQLYNSSQPGSYMPTGTLPYTDNGGYGTGGEGYGGYGGYGYGGYGGYGGYDYGSSSYYNPWNRYQQGSPARAGGAAPAALGVRSIASQPYSGYADQNMAARWIQLLTNWRI